MIDELCCSVRERSPLIHCITNPISINQCANAALALGARPIMAEHPGEAAEITATAGALLLNTGNITDARMESMAISAAVARDREIPWALDAVGAACSTMRRDFILRLISDNPPTLIKGNYSEIRALWDSSYSSAGVDADGTLGVDAMAAAAAALARSNGTMVLASGKTDIVTDGTRTAFIDNGTPQLGSVTGTGCMLGVICACMLAVSQDIHAVAAACGILGIAGELAATEKGPGTFMGGLMDAIWSLSLGGADMRLNMEEICVEKP